MMVVSSFGHVLFELAFQFLASLFFLSSCFSRGYNIGVRLIDEFLAKSNVSRCVDFKETAEVIAKVLMFNYHGVFFLFPKRGTLRMDGSH